MSRLPLEGVRVVELTTGAAGPTVGKVLAEFGAEVIHVETRKRGDAHRGPDPVKWNKRPDFVKLHRHKKSFTANMSTEQGREVVKSLIRQSDVLVENYALGVIEQWGLAYDDLKQLKSDIILVRVKGLGCTGPHAADRTWGPNIGNINGTTYLWNYPDSTVPTAEARSQHPDFMGGVTAAFGVVLALIHRKKTGQGQWIDSAQAEVGASLLGPRFLEYTVNGREPRPVGNDSLVAAPHGVYRCQGEDNWCVIGIYSQEEWTAFCDAVGHQEWRTDARFATHLSRVRHKTELDAVVEDWTKEHDRYQITEQLQKVGVMAVPVQDVADVFQRDKQYAARGFLVTLDEPEAGRITAEGVPVRLSETPGRIQCPAPLMGEHTYQICRELLGLSDERIRVLEEEGALT